MVFIPVLKNETLEWYQIKYQDLTYYYIPKVTKEQFGMMLVESADQGTMKLCPNEQTCSEILEQERRANAMNLAHHTIYVCGRSPYNQETKQYLPTKLYRLPSLSEQEARDPFVLQLYKMLLDELGMNEHENQQFQFAVLPYADRNENLIQFMENLQFQKYEANQIYETFPTHFHKFIDSDHLREIGYQNSGVDILFKQNPNISKKIKVLQRK